MIRRLRLDHFFFHLKTVRRAERNAKLQLANVQIEMLEAKFNAKSNGGYKATARVKNFLLDDLRASNQADSVTRMIDRHFTVDPNVQMLVTTFEFKPKEDSRVALRDRMSNDEILL